MENAKFLNFSMGNIHRPSSQKRTLRVFCAVDIADADANFKY